MSITCTIELTDEEYGYLKDQKLPHTATTQPAKPRVRYVRGLDEEYFKDVPALLVLDYMEIGSFMDWTVSRLKEMTTYDCVEYRLWKRIYPDLYEGSGRRVSDTKAAKAQAEEDAKCKHPDLEDASVTCYKCANCDKVITEDDIIEVRQCSGGSCGAIFDATSNGRNCEQCGRGFTRLMTKHGCPDCVGEDECEELDDIKYCPACDEYVEAAEETVNA